MTTLQDPESLSQFVAAEADATHKEGGALLPRSRPEHHHHRSHSGGGLEALSRIEAPPTREPPPVDEEVKAHLEEAQHLEAPRLDVPYDEAAPQAAAEIELDPLKLMQEELARLEHAFESATEEPAHEPEDLEPVPPVKEQMSSADLNDLLTEALVPVEPEVQPVATTSPRGAPLGWAAALEPPTKKVPSGPVVLPPPQTLNTPAALDTAAKGPTALKWTRPEAVIVVIRPKVGRFAKLRAQFSPRG